MRICGGAPSKIIWRRRSAAVRYTSAARSVWPIQAGCCMPLDQNLCCCQCCCSRWVCLCTAASARLTLLADDGVRRTFRSGQTAHGAGLPARSCATAIDARDWMLDRVVNEEEIGIGMLRESRLWLEELPAHRLAEALTGGVAKSELP